MRRVPGVSDSSVIRPIPVHLELDQCLPLLAIPAYGAARLLDVYSWVDVGLPNSLHLKVAIPRHLPTCSLEKVRFLFYCAGVTDTAENREEPVADNPAAARDVCRKGRRSGCVQLRSTDQGDRSLPIPMN